jgi:hypothetical protein
MSYSRTRTLINPGHTGTSTFKYYGTVETDTAPGGSHYCADVVGDMLGDNPLTIRHEALLPPLLGGETPGIFGYSYSNYPVANPAYSGHLSPMTSEPSTLEAATQVAAKTNPSRPDVSVPLLLKESLESVVKAVFNHGKRKSDNSLVSGSFGWEQLYRDATKIFDFADGVDKRAKELNQLYSSGGLKRRRTVWTDTSTENVVNVTLHSSGGVVIGKRSTKTTRIKWVAIRWQPDDPVNLPSAEDNVRLARTLIHGWHFAPEDVWNALPWSWAVDYFFNVGSYLGATRNSVGSHIASLCTCTTITTLSRITPTSMTDGLTCSNGREDKIDKYRVPSVIGLTATSPFLSVRQLATLSSIALNYKG